MVLLWFGLSLIGFLNYSWFSQCFCSGNGLGSSRRGWGKALGSSGRLWHALGCYLLIDNMYENIYCMYIYIYTYEIIANTYGNIISPKNTYGNGRIHMGI